MSVEVRCRQHPGYLAMRRPTSSCMMCQWMWNTFSHLRQLHGHDYVLRFFRKVNRDR